MTNNLIQQILSNYMPKAKQNNKQKVSTNEDFDLDQDDSFDQAFRLEKKAIGKRTNIMFDKRQAKDGFIDVKINSKFQNKEQSSLAKLQNSSSDIDLSALMQSSLSQNSIKKNERMVKHIKNMQIDVSDQQVSQLTEDSQSYYSVQRIETIEENRNQSPQTGGVGNMKQDQVNNTQKKIQSKNQKKDTKDVDTQKSTPCRQQLLKKQSTSKLKKELNDLKNNQFVKPISKKNQQRLKQITKKIIPRRKNADIRPRIQKQNLFKVQIPRSQDKTSDYSIYEPYGTIGQSKYPRRLRMEPLRYWLCQSKQYERGQLSGVYLADDRRGLRKAQQLQEQVDNFRY